MGIIKTKAVSETSVLISSMSWTLTQVLVGQGSNVLVRIALAVLIAPEAFGVFTMAAVVSGLLGAMTEYGLAAALIQMDSSKLQHKHFNAAFWMSIALSSIVFLVLAGLLAPIYAASLGEPALMIIIPVLMIAPYLHSLGIISRVKLARQLKFKLMSQITMTAQVTSVAVAVVLAMNEFGLWSLVFQAITLYGLMAVFTCYQTRWLPSLNLSMSAVREIYKFSGYDIQQRILIYMSANLDKIIIAKLLGSGALGIYAFCLLITEFIRQQLMSAVNKVMFTGFSRVQNDLKKVKYYHLEIVRYSTLTVTPFMLVVILFSENSVGLLFGEKWALAIIPLQLLGAAAIIHCTGGASSSLLKGLGRSKLDAGLYFTKTFLCTVPLIMILASMYGLNGAAAAVLLSKICTRLIYQSTLKKVIGLTEAETLRCMKHTFFAATVMICMAYLTSLFYASSSLLSLSLAAGISFFSYAVVAVYLNKTQLIRLLKSRFINSEENVTPTF